MTPEGDTRARLPGFWGVDPEVLTTVASASTGSDASRRGISAYRFFMWLKCLCLTASDRPVRRLVTEVVTNILNQENNS
jgi:hypothetical protein